MTTSPLILDRLWHSLFSAFAHLPANTGRTVLRASAHSTTTLRPKCAAFLAQSVRHASTTHSPIRFTAQGSEPYISQAIKKEYEQRLASASADELDNVETSQIYLRLRRLAADGNMDRVNRMVSYLLARRGEAPNVALYSVVILANVNAAQGSAARVAALLREMGEEGLEPTAEICHDTLKVCFVLVLAYAFVEADFGKGPGCSPGLPPQRGYNPVHAPKMVQSDR